jgi:hypothetical protein
MNAEMVSQYLITHPFLLFMIILWSLLWKGLATWKAAKKDQPIWFAVLLAVNFLGLLEILYLFVFSELISKRDSKIKPKKKRSR